MKEISFKPRGFKTGVSYKAELLLNSGVVDSINNLVQNTTYEFTVSNPGTYVLKVSEVPDGACVFSRIVQALFPIVVADEGEVDCGNNTYSVIITLQNPVTAGNNVQYGWSLLNDCSTVGNWNNIPELIFPADDVPRYIFVRNEDQQCCNFVTTTSRSPCVSCGLEVIDIVFSCNE